MCQTHTISNNFKESEIISLDAEKMLDGVLLIVSVLGNTNQNRTKQDDLLKKKRDVSSPPHTIHKSKQSRTTINVLDNIDAVPSNVQSSRQETLLYVFEDNEAVINMIIKEKGVPQ